MVEVLKEDDEPKEKADFALVLGGDGTLLRACKKLCKYDIPMLGINYGHLGYLTECNPDMAISSIDKTTGTFFTCLGDSTLFAILSLVYFSTKRNL